MSLDPPYFDIIDFNRNAVLPSICVYSGVFNMKERENPILMSPETEVAFLGYKNQDVSALREMSSTPILAKARIARAMISIAQLKPTVCCKV